MASRRRQNRIRMCADRLNVSEVAWPVLEDRFGKVYFARAGMPPLPTRLMAGLAILKHNFNLSDEALRDRWVENPYFQYLCGEEFFRKHPGAAALRSW